MSLEYFDPVDYSNEENTFLLTHLGEPTVVALSEVKPSYLLNPTRDKQGNVKDKNPVYFPNGVNPAAVRPILDRVIELEELSKHKGEPWVGVEAVKDAIRTYLTANAKWEADSKRGAPRWPSLYTFDGKGQGHLSGPGSDSGKIRTYFDQSGNRKPFRISLLGVTQGTWKPDWVGSVAEASKQALTLVVDSVKNRIECPVCAHTESFKAESRASYNAARARMSRHLRNAKDETSLHRELHTNEFTS